MVYLKYDTYNCHLKIYLYDKHVNPGYLKGFISLAQLGFCKFVLSCKLYLHSHLHIKKRLKQIAKD